MHVISRGGFTVLESPCQLCREVRPGGLVVKTILFGLILSTALALPAQAALKPGTRAPDFSAQASVAGKDFKFSLAEALKKGPVVVYFYPSAYTGGCNIEAHTFAINQEKFDAAGASILGVSHDNIARLNDFSADPEYCAGKFPVASDPDGSIAKSYDLKVMEKQAGAKDTRGVEIDHAFTERSTFVIAPDSKIVAVFSSADDKISPADHVTKSLEVVKQLAGGKAN
jgi:thioredoxin-dependent peroxiredoxin